MLQFNRNLEYALMSLRYLLQQAPQKLTSSREIADKLHIPYDNVAKALQKFAKLEWVESAHGVAGGYRIKADFSKVTVFDVIEGVEGPVAIVRCQSGEESCDMIDSCNVHSPFQKLNHQFVDLLRSQNILEFLNSGGSVPQAPRSSSSSNTPPSSGNSGNSPAAAQPLRPNDDFAVWQ